MSANIRTSLLLATLAAAAVASPGCASSQEDAEPEVTSAAEGAVIDDAAFDDIAEGASEGTTDTNSDPSVEGATTSDAEDPHVEEDANSPPPNDDPNIGADDMGSDEVMSSSEELNGACKKGGFYCGGDKLKGNSKWLYRCNGSAAPSLVKQCSSGCRVNTSGYDDTCKGSSTSSSNGKRVSSPVPGRRVTYGYGAKNRRYKAGYHTGDDYAAPKGSNAVAVRDGVVKFSNNAGGSYGRWMGILADNGRLYVYCHLSSRLLASGARVKAGQVIAKVGATGNVTGPHLHLEDHAGRFSYGRGRKPSW